ncbi:MAG: MarR family transcriptional regulator [Acidovorax sp.]
MSHESRLDRILAGKPRRLRDAVGSSRLVIHTAHLLEQRIDAALAPFNLHMREYLALALLADSVHEPLRPSTLSTALDATRTQTTRLLDGLEHKGLAVRTADGQDRRSLQLAPTAAGAELLARAVPVVHAAYEAAWAPLSAQGLSALNGQLRSVHSALLEGTQP